MIKLQKIDESLLLEYSCIEMSDHCYFLGEYASGRGFNHSEMNQVINNFKKPIDRKDLPEWYYKEQAILKIADWIVSTTSWTQLKSATWVPLPPSKIKSDLSYDDRLWRVLCKIKEIESSLDIRELILTKASRVAAHEPGAVRPKIQDHLENFIFDKTQKNPSPSMFVLFDDIITSGAHFKAAQTIIQKEFQETPIIGLFVARNMKLEDGLLKGKPN